MSDELECALRELGRQLELSSDGPELAAAVAARLHARPRARRRRLRPLALAFAALALALAVALAVPPARSALLRLLDVGGVTIERVERLPELEERRLALGEPVTLARAREAVEFHLLVPAGGDELAIYLDRSVPGGMVTVVWPGRPRLLLSQFAGELLLKKVVAGKTRLEPVAVDGRQGVWIEGAPHLLAYTTPEGELRRDRTRLAGNVLVWTVGGTTLRLEGERLTKQRALAIARSLE